MPDAKSGIKKSSAHPLFIYAVVLSILIHSLVILPAVALEWLIQSSPQQESLNLELWGMIAEREVEEKNIGAEEQQTYTEEEATPETLGPEQPVIEETQPEENEVITEPESIQVEKPAEEKPEPALKPERRPQPQPVRPAPISKPQTVKPVLAPNTTKGVEEEQKQQTIAQETEATIMRKYLVSLRKTIESNLIYPSAARKEGAIGSPVIRFTITESGYILSGTLIVYKSSGFAILDEQAKKAALDSVPLPRPPRQIEVTIAISFKEKI